MNSDADILRSLNDDINLDLIKKFDLIDNPFNPYNDHEVQCLYYDETSLLNFPCADKSLVMSLNIRSISSNFDELQHFICELESKIVPFDIISLQEVCVGQLSWYVHIVDSGLAGVHKKRGADSNNHEDSE